MPYKADGRTQSQDYPAIISSVGLDPDPGFTVVGEKARIVASSQTATFDNNYVTG